MPVGACLRQQALVLQDIDMQAPCAAGERNQNGVYFQGAPAKCRMQRPERTP